MNSLPATNPSEFAPLVCIDRIEETADAATFVFQTTDATPLNFKAGQFVVFQVDVADETLHRAYSLSSSPNHAEKVSIAVKRVSGGKVSNHLIDHLQPGHMLRSLPPDALHDGDLLAAGDIHSKALAAWLRAHGASLVLIDPARD